jgi:hypothetical protein
MNKKDADRIRHSDLPQGVVVWLKFISVTKQTDDDSRFVTDCRVLSGDHREKMIRLYWSKKTKTGNDRKDYRELVEAMGEGPSRKLIGRTIECQPQEINGFKFVTGISEVDLTSFNVDEETIPVESLKDGMTF